MISVVLCCRNERHSIKQAITAIAEQIDEVSEPVEVIVACNRSTDGTEEVVRGFPFRRILLDDNYHSSVLHNIALQECRGEFILFLDGDMILGPASLATVRRNFEDPDIAGMCGYKWADLEQISRIDQIRDLVYAAKSGKPKLRQHTIVSLDHVYTMTGGVFAVRAAALRAVGGYDPSFRRYACDDIYVEMRLLNKGHLLCYDPAITAYHMHLHSSAREFRWRAYVGTPRGLAHLLQRSAEFGLKVPFDGNVMHVPVLTTGLLLAGIAAAASGWPYGIVLLAVGAAAQAAELIPFFTCRPGSYRMAVRLGGAAFWLTANTGRLAFCTALWFRRLAPQRTSVMVTGVAEEPGQPPRRIEHRMDREAPSVGGLAFRLGLARVLLGLWWSMLRRGAAYCGRALRRGRGSPTAGRPASNGPGRKPRYLPPEPLRRVLRRPRPPHILLEGLDYAGKSTVAQRLADRIADAGYTVRINNGGLYRGHFRKVAWTIRDRLGPDPLPFLKRYYLNWIYTAVAFADGLAYRAEANTIVIQESYADRMAAYQRGHSIKFFPGLVIALSGFLVQFDVTVCLTVSPVARRKRFGQREEKRDGTDWEIITQPEEMWKSELELHRLVGKRASSHILDSTELTAEETLEHVWRLVRPVLPGQDRAVGRHDRPAASQPAQQGQVLRGEYGFRRAAGTDVSPPAGDTT